MPIIHPGATLRPRFREFLPGWVGRQPWYVGSDPAELVSVGYFRFEDPAGEVGVETHLLRDCSGVYQVPLTYRDSPLGGQAGAGEALVTTAEHSVLGTRWIYDAVADPVWVAELLSLVATDGVSVPGSKRGVCPAEARGVRIGSGELSPRTVTIDLKRLLPAHHPHEHRPAGPDVAGLVMGSWRPDGPEGPLASGCLAVLRTRDGAVPGTAQRA